MAEKPTAKDIIQRGKEEAEKVKKEREEVQDKLTAKDNLISNTGNLLVSNKKAKEAWKLLFDNPIGLIRGHIETVENFKKQQRDNYARVLMTFDMTHDYSSAEWEEDLERHRARLGELEALKKAFEEGQEDNEMDSSESEEDGNGTNSDTDSPIPGNVGGSDSSGEELEQDNESGE